MKEILLDLLADAGWSDDFIKNYLAGEEAEPVLIPIPL